MIVPAGTELGGAVRRAQQAMEAGRYREAAAHYRRAVEEAEASARVAVRRALWIEHVAGLLKREQLGEGAEWARRYVGAARDVGDGQAELELWVLLAESLAAQGDWAECRLYVAKVITRLGERAEWRRQLGAREPHLIRLEGLLAAQEGALAQARGLLDEAGRLFAAAGVERGRRVVENDVRALALAAGSRDVLDEVLGRQGRDSISQILQLALALQRDAQYEMAARVIEDRLRRDVEPALRFPLLYQLARVYATLPDWGTVERLIPLLREAAAAAPDPADANADLERLAQWRKGRLVGGGGTGFEAKLHNVRALLQDRALDQAAETLALLRPEVNTDRRAAYWSLVAGEVELARALESKDVGGGDHAGQALSHLKSTVELAQKSSLPEVHSQSLRLIGTVYDRVYQDLNRASACWLEASRADELVAHRQESDLVRIRYLEARPTQYDDLIAAAAARVRDGKGAAVAGVIVAMEAARGAAILSKVLPDGAERMRHLPHIDNPQECVAWCLRVTSRLPRDMAVWLLHSTPDRVHHGLLGRDVMHWSSLVAERHELNEVIERLKDFWEVPGVLEDVVQHEPHAILDLLAEIAGMLRIDLALGALPAGITRLAIVAGGMLGDVPFAALLLPGSSGQEAPLIARYAISDLPCLSAQRPLAWRAGGVRGDDGLRVRPRSADLAHRPGSLDRDFRWLQDEEATIARLESTLAGGEFPLLRFDCHGHADDEALRSWLQLTATEADEGRLYVERFQDLPLTRCGTVMLGACESGMSQRLGRDERLGFVRAGLGAGAAAVLAARWVAEDLVAGAVLDRFQRYLHYLPRDRALQQAQLDVIEGRCVELGGADGSLPRPEHPARWACWTLYGDAGVQTHAGRVRRAMRRLVAGRRGAARATAGTAAQERGP